MCTEDAQFVWLYCITQVSIEGCAIKKNNNNKKTDAPLECSTLWNINNQLKSLKELMQY